MISDCPRATTTVHALGCRLSRWSALIDKMMKSEQHAAFSGTPDPRQTMPCACYCYDHDGQLWGRIPNIALGARDAFFFSLIRQRPCRIKTVDRTWLKAEILTKCIRTLHWNHSQSPTTGLRPVDHLTRKIPRRSRSRVSRRRKDFAVAVGWLPPPGRFNARIPSPTTRVYNIAPSDPTSICMSTR